MTTPAAQVTTESPTRALGLIYAARTDRGKRRTINQDYVYAGALNAASDGPARHLLIVADGVGGHQQGEWASEQTTLFVVRELPSALEDADPAEALRLTVEAANRYVWHEAFADPAKRTAATTFVAVIVEGNRLWWANVGDSRAYLIHADGFEQLTLDHSWVAEQVRAGLLTEEEAAKSNQRNIITRGVGVDATVVVDTAGPITFQVDDQIVLCSDGLHGPVGDAEIARHVRELPPDAAADRLIALANERGGPDNISVVAGRLEPINTPSPRPTSDEPSPTLEVPFRSRRGSPVIVIVFVVFMLAMAMIFIPMLFEAISSQYRYDAGPLPETLGTPADIVLTL